MVHIGTWLRSSAGDTMDSQRIAEDARKSRACNAWKVRKLATDLGAPCVQFASRSRLLADKAVGMHARGPSHDICSGFM